MSVTAIARKDHPADSSREALREAQAVAAAARKKRATTEAAIERAENLRMETRRKVEAAGKAIAAARAEDVQQLAAAITDGAVVAPQATKRAKEAEAEASDALAMARAAVEQLEGDLRDADDAVTYADMAVDRALAVLLGPLATEMIEAVRRRHVHYLQAQAALTAMGSVFVSGSEIARAIDSTGSFNVDADRRVAIPAAQAMRTALVALRESADAPLPSLDETTTPPRAA